MSKNAYEYDQNSYYNKNEIECKNVRNVLFLYSLYAFYKTVIID